MATKAVAVPDLPHTPPLDIDSSDMQLPRIHLGQFMSKAVQEQLVSAGAVYSSIGSDDPDPVVLWDPKAKDAKGVLFHVLGLVKGRSWVVDGNLERGALNDPDAPADSWVTYDYVVCLPEVDAEVPYKMLFTRTQTSCAKSINTVLKKNEARGPSYATAFRLTAAERENAKGKFYVPRATVVESDLLDAVTPMALAMSNAQPQKGTVDEPAI